MAETIDENIDRLCKKYDNSYERVEGMIRLIAGDLKIRRPQEYKYHKELFNRKAYLIANHRLYIEHKFKSEKTLSEEYQNQ